MSGSGPTRKLISIVAGRLAFCLLLTAGNVLFSQWVEAAGNGQNAGVAAALCTIKTRLEALEEIKAFRIPDHIRQIVEEVERLNISTLPESLFNQKELPPYNEQQWKSRRNSLEEKSTAIDGEEVKIKFVGILAGAGRANERINRLLTGAEHLSEEYRLKVEAANQELEQAKLKAREALFGHDVAEADGKSFGDTLVESCGQAGSSAFPGLKAGLSLANDFTCLCGKGHSSRDGLACTSASVQLGSHNSWASGGDGKTLWDQAKVICPENQIQNITPAELTSALDAYYTFVNKNHGGKKAGFVVGFSASNNGYCGATEATTACVSYPSVGQTNLGAAATQTSAPYVSWLVNGSLAANHLRRAQELYRVLPHIEAKMEQLRTRAWDIYENLLGSEMFQPKGKLKPGIEEDGEKQGKVNPTVTAGANSQSPNLAGTSFIAPCIVYLFMLS